MNTKLAVIAYLCDSLADTLGTLAVSHPALAAGPASGHVHALKRDAEQLGKAWSEMALRNVLSDILRTVNRISALDLNPKPVARAGAGGGGWVTGKSPASAGWKTGNAPRSGPAMGGIGGARAASVVTDVCRDLVKRIDAELKQHSPSKARYSQAVCIGYKVKVAGDKYSGAVDDGNDMRTRCADMKAAIQSAYALADHAGSYNTATNVLKVFMAPEFFFRGRNGAYDHSVVHGVEKQTNARGATVVAKTKGIVETMMEEIDDPKYKDWLFVLGTAIGAVRDSRTVCRQPGGGGPVAVPVDRATGKSKPTCTKNAAHPVGESFATAYVENVGFIVKEGEVHTVTKELVSGIDYVADEAAGRKDIVGVKTDGVTRALAVGRHAQPSGYNAATNVPTKFVDERMGGCIFTIDGITIGVEVCLDHAASTSNANGGRLEHAGNIQLQMVPSAGMSITSLRTVPGGIVFNVDGLYPAVQVVAGANPTAQFGIGTEEWAFDATTWSDLVSIGTDVDKLTALRDAGKGSWRPISSTSHIAPAGSGSVVLYGPYDIPRI